MKYFYIILDASWDVDYGIECASYLAGIYTSREEAQTALESDRFKLIISKIMNEPGSYGGQIESVDSYIKEFNESMIDLSDLCIDGGSYAE